MLLASHGHKPPLCVCDGQKVAVNPFKRNRPAFRDNILLCYNIILSLLLFIIICTFFRRRYTSYF